MADADLPLSAFESMLRMYDRLLMTASAEGVFIDVLAAGHAPHRGDMLEPGARARARRGEPRGQSARVHGNARHAVSVSFSIIHYLEPYYEK